MRHVFLTGEIQVGKSFAIKRFLSMSKLKADGFATYFDFRENSDRGLLIAPYGAEGLGAKEAVHFSGGNITVFTEVFDGYGAEILEASGKGGLIVMDELGVFEENAEKFKAAVLRILSGSTPVVGVVKQKRSQFLDHVRSLPNVSVIEVGLENRGEIPGMLLKAFS